MSGSGAIAGDRSGLGVAHSPRLNRGDDLLAALANDMVQEAFLDIHVVVTSFFVLGGRCCRRRCGSSCCQGLITGREAAIEHGYETGALHELHDIAFIRGAPEKSAPHPQQDCKRELDGVSVTAETYTEQTNGYFVVAA